MDTKKEITKEEIINYYIVENHSRKETADYFNIKENSLRLLLKKYQIVKDKQKIVENSKKTFLKHYGVESYFKTQECETFLTESCQKKYGVNRYSQAQEIKDKTKQTCQKKYGQDYYVMTEEFKKKSIATCLEKYNTESYTQTEESKERRKKTNLELYNVENYNQKDIKHYDIWRTEENFINFLKSQNKKMTLKEISEYFNVDQSAIHARFNKEKIDEYIDLFPKRSIYEDEIIKVLNDMKIYNIKKNTKEILSNREIDIYLPDYNFGIEFNGNYWHCDIFHPDHNGRSTYHQEKSLLAEKQGVFIFNIFEYEWEDPTKKENIIARLQTILNKNKIKISARKCEIVNLSKEEKKNFLNENHFQGNDHSTIYIGLKYNNEIISCMTFVHPKNNKYTWELSRFCCKKGCTIQGGASKLFKHFTNTLNSGDTISSYNDITKTKGDLYQTLGFTCISINSPNYIWYNFHTKNIRTRYQEQEAGEVERMHSKKYYRICDCGTKTWLYTKN